jgi:hypothetical protein
VSNVLSVDKQKQVVALGQLGWTLRRIQKETGVRRETAAGYLKAAGIAVRPPGRWGRLPPAKPAIEVTTDSAPAKPANEAGQVTTDSGGPGHPRGPSARACCRSTADRSELGGGRNAMAIWRDLVDQHIRGAYERQTLRSKLRGSRPWSPAPSSSPRRRRS